MFWADRIAQEIEKKFGNTKPVLLRDEKTVSGRVHVGSMRGVAIHGAVHEALAGRGVKNTFKYELNDFDVFDSIPDYLLREKFEKYLGMMLRDVPSPEPSAKNFAEYFGNEFREVIEGAGFSPEFYWGSELYLSGKMDGVIREAIEHSSDIVRIYKEVSGSQKEGEWLPIAVVCPQCGKVATTESSDFDGSTVQVHCRIDKAPYTNGCGYKGRVSPFGGKAKLLWKVEWPAKWKVNGVLVEGAGKDHSTKGGSRDVGTHISKEVFNYEPPFDVPYEFFLVGGKKMSSSKGRGSSAKEIAALVPAKIFRLALLGKEINQQVNFDPEGDTIPVLYDQYDKLALGYQTTKDDDYARLFELIHPHGMGESDSPKNGRVRLSQVPGVLPRFSQVAFVVQMPHLELEKEFPDAEVAELQERARYAKHWLEEYAPEKFVFKLQDTLPAVEITKEQKTNIKQILEFLNSKPDTTAEEIHGKLHELKAFKEIYLIFLGKDHGPKAGWFLASLSREFVLNRLREASS